MGATKKGHLAGNGRLNLIQTEENQESVRDQNVRKSEWEKLVESLKQVTLNWVAPNSK